MLALLVALVSVLALSAPMFSQLITPNDSDIVVTMQGINDGSIYLTASNTGNRPGSINDAVLSIQHPLVEEAPLVNAMKLGPRLVAAGAAQQIIIPISIDDRKLLDASWWEALEHRYEQFTVTLIVRTSSFSGKPSTIQFEFPVREFMLAGGTGWHKCIVENFYSDEWGRPREVKVAPKREAIQKECGSIPYDGLV